MIDLDTNKNFIKEYAGGNAHIEIDLPTAEVISGTWSYGTGAGYTNYTQFFNISDSVGDEVKFSVYLDAGSYNLNLVHYKFTNLGIIQINVDGVSIGTVDMYSAGYIQPALSQVSLTVAAPKQCTISIKIIGKNPSSSLFYCVLHGMGIVRL